MNSQSEQQLEDLIELKDEMNHYFYLLKKRKIDENYVHEMGVTQKIKRGKELLLLLVLTPTALLGLLHCGIPYVWIKKFVQRSFKRRVFWGSVKLLLGMIVMGILNIPFIFIFYDLIYASYFLAFIYYTLIGLFGLSAYTWWQTFLRYKEKGHIRNIDLSDLVKKRTEILNKIHQLISVA